MLKVTGRIHEQRRYLRCYDEARKAGFKNINIDLMFALPGQTMEMLKSSLKTAIELNP